MKTFKKSLLFGILVLLLLSLSSSVSASSGWGFRKNNKHEVKSKIKCSKCSTYLLKPTPLLHKPQDASDLISQDPEPP